jgi:hypothetical protein
MSELKRCPFCGGEAIIYEDEENSCYMIGCRECCAVEPMTEWCESKENAIAQWNYRKPMEEIVERLEERTEYFKDCTKYGNETEEQEERSYSTMMMYEVANLVDDLIEIVKEEGGMNEGIN